MGVPSTGSGGVHVPGVLCAGLALVLFWGVAPSLAATAPKGAKVPVPAVDPSTRFGIDDSLNRVVIPAQTPSFVGGQEPPLMEVTPGNRFMKILVAHVALYQDSRTGLGLTDDQKARLRGILEKTRAELIKTDAADLRLVQLFEAALSKRVVPVPALRSLNVRIGETEGREAGRFVASLQEMQAVLSLAQISTLKQKNAEVLPSSDIAVSSALAFADRILAMRWQAAMARKMPSKARYDLAARYRKARVWLWSLAAEKTVSDRNVDDLLASPFVDMAKLDTLEKTAGPLEGRFWATFLRIVVLLNPPSR